MSHKVRKQLPWKVMWQWIIRVQLKTCKRWSCLECSHFSILTEYYFTRKSQKTLRNKGTLCAHPVQLSPGQQWKLDTDAETSTHIHSDKHLPNWLTQLCSSHSQKKANKNTPVSRQNLWGKGVGVCENDWVTTYRTNITAVNYCSSGTSQAVMDPIRENAISYKQLKTGCEEQTVQWVVLS